MTSRSRSWSPAWGTWSADHDRSPGRNRLLHHPGGFHADHSDDHQPGRAGCDGASMRTSRMDRDDKSSMRSRSRLACSQQSERHSSSCILGCPAAGWQAAWKAGTARVITPKTPMWMSGYAARTKPSQGVVHDLWAKALAIEDPSGRPRHPDHARRLRDRPRSLEPRPRRDPIAAIGSSATRSCWPARTRIPGPSSATTCSRCTTSTPEQPTDRRVHAVSWRRRSWS